MKMRYDVAIIGGGVAGATAAILLAQAGWSVALVEKRVFPRRKVCGECVAATNLPLLDALGIGSKVDELAGPRLKQVALYVGDEVINADLPGLDHSRHRWGRALGRERLDTLLLERAAALGAHIWQPCAVKDVRRKRGTFECAVATGSDGYFTVTAPMVVGAHGSWEPSPRAADRRRRSPCASDLFAFKANFAASRLQPGILPVVAFSGGYGGLVMGEHGKLTLACCIRRDRLQQCRATRPGLAAGEAVQMWLQAACFGVREALADARREGPWLAVGPLRPGVRPAWNRDRGFAIGNAAGEAHPILGEGISMAMQSAWLLCDRLTRHGPPAASEDAQLAAARDYARQWRKNFGPRMRWAAVFSHLAMRPAAAGALIPVMRRWPVLLTAGARCGGKVQGLDVSEQRPALPH